MQSFFAAEGQLLLMIQEFVRWAPIHRAVQFITHLGDAGFIWIVLTLVLLIVPRTRKVGGCCALALVLNLLVTNGLLKNIFQRTRPYDVIPSLKILVEAEHDFSFPSGHTACSFAGAWALWRCAPKKYAVPALVLAVLISLSRLYVGVHYPTDVLGGLAAGMLCAEAAYRLHRRFCAKNVEKISKD